MLQDKQKIKQWLDSMAIENYTINDDFTVDVDGSVIIEHKQLTYLPVQFGIVKGSFDCSHDNALTSLQGIPQSIRGYFDCSNNKLISLQGCPQHVGGNFYCSSNLLTTLQGCILSVNGAFYCGNNLLNTLEGCPQSVKGDFNCSFNLLTSLEYCPKSIGGSFYCIDNPLINIDLNTFDSNFNEVFYHGGTIIEEFSEFYIEGELRLTYKEIENIKLNNKLNNIIKNKAKTINSINKKKL